MMKVYAVYMHDHTGDHQINVFRTEEERQEYIDADIRAVVNILSSDGYDPNFMKLVDRQEVFAANGDIYYEWICDDAELKDEERGYESTAFRQLSYKEVSQLKKGDKIAIGIGDRFVSATVVRPMFWNSDADEPDWEVETDNGFVDVYSIYTRN